MTPILEGIRIAGREAVERKLWPNVEIKGADDCWEWQRCMQTGRYGAMVIAGVRAPAHRVSFVLAYGIEPPVVMHRCDNPPCCNPAHLRAGTHQENTLDCVAKGRRSPTKRKLTETTVRTLRAAYGERYPMWALFEHAKFYGVLPQTLHSAVKGYKWTGL